MKEMLLQELKEAMRQKDERRKNTIMLLRSAILQVEKDGQKELSEEEMIGIVAKEVKKRRDSLMEYEKAGRMDIVENLNEEIAILAKYLPKQLEKEEIETLVSIAILEVGATSPKEMGKVMQQLKEKTNGKADGKLVSEIVRNALANM